MAKQLTGSVAFITGEAPDGSAACEHQMFSGEPVRLCVGDPGTVTLDIGDATVIIGDREALMASLAALPVPQ